MAVACVLFKRIVHQLHCRMKFFWFDRKLKIVICTPLAIRVAPLVSQEQILTAAPHLESSLHWFASHAKAWSSIRATVKLLTESLPSSSGIGPEMPVPYIHQRLLSNLLFPTIPSLPDISSSSPTLLNRNKAIKQFVYSCSMMY